MLLQKLFLSWANVINNWTSPTSVDPLLFQIYLFGMTITELWYYYDRVGYIVIVDLPEYSFDPNSSSSISQSSSITFTVCIKLAVRVCAGDLFFFQ